MQRRGGALAGACAGLLLVALPACAYWSADGVTGSARAVGASLPAGAQPSASATGSSVAVTWAQSSPPGLGSLGANGGGYVVTRYSDGSSNATAPGSACSGIIAAVGPFVSCTEAGVPEGRWRYTITPRLNSWAGAQSSLSPAVLIDLTAPTTTATLTPAPNAAGWNNGSIGIGLTASDNAGGSGVSSISYGAAGAQSIATTGYTSPFSITAQGTTTVSYRAADYAGNTETTKTQLVRIDSTAPTGSITSPGAGSVVTGTTTVAANSSDAHSGVASAAFERAPLGSSTWTRFATDTTAPYQSSLDTTTLSDGTWQIRVVTTDVAGNVFTSAPRTLIVENASPFGVDIFAQNGGVAGTIDAGDAVTYAFSEPMAPGSILSSWTGAARAVSVRVQNGGSTGDRLTVVGVDLGTVRLGLRTWVRSGTATIAATMTMVGDNTVVITLSSCSSGCSNFATGVGPTTFTWTPVSGATDLAGNAMDTTVVTESNGPQQNL